MKTSTPVQEPFDVGATNLKNDPRLLPRSQMAALDLDPVSITRMCVAVGEALQYCGILAEADTSTSPGLTPMSPA